MSRVDAVAENSADIEIYYGEAAAHAPARRGRRESALEMENLVDAVYPGEPGIAVGQGQPHLDPVAAHLPPTTGKRPPQNSR